MPMRRGSGGFGWGGVSSMIPPHRHKALDLVADADVTSAQVTSPGAPREVLVLWGYYANALRGGREGPEVV